MMVFLSKIEAAFTVPKRGCAVVPVNLTDRDLRVKAGDAVQIRGPNGRLDARIGSIERLVRRDNGCCIAFLLLGDIDRSQIGPAAEIWIESASAETVNS
jgi:hypothetical protein